MELSSRPRRNRSLKNLREGIKEVDLNASSFIQPLFVSENTEPIKAMPGVQKYSLDDLKKFCIKTLSKSKICGVLLFASIDKELKTKKGDEALNPEGLLPRAIKIVKEHAPHLVVMSDVALDPFSTDGHDGLVENGKILNDESVDLLCMMSLVHAKAGVDFVAPSDMMDGRVKAIRKTLDKNGFSDTGILSYTAKYASFFYGPFREALDSAPGFGDKKTYQMDFRNKTESLRELRADIFEGADMVMVKPALAYLDIIQSFKKESTVPVVAYNVSAEYSMVKLAAQAGLVNEYDIQFEILSSMKRSGADLIVTYSALEMETHLKKNESI